MTTPARIVFAFYAASVSGGDDGLVNWNDDSKPFVWHNNADEILDSLAAYCQRMNDSGH